MEKKKKQRVIISLVIFFVIMGSLVIIFSKSNNRLSERQILELREKYPICGVEEPPMLSMTEITLEDSIEQFDSFVYGEVIGDYTTYYQTISTGNDEVDAKFKANGIDNVYEFYEYTLSVIEDTEGKYEEGELITISSNAVFKNFNAKLSDGMKVVVPVSRLSENSSRSIYMVVGMYYVTEEGYALSAFDENTAATARTTYSGIKVENLLKELAELKK